MDRTQQLEKLRDVILEWNEKINVTAIRDPQEFDRKNVQDSLAILPLPEYEGAKEVLDMGTGGGFPGIPLAILFPEVRFKLIDGTGKKIRVVNEVSSAIGLRNVEAVQLRGEEEQGRFDFVVSRAVMPLPDLVKLIRKNIARRQLNSIGNGLLCLKGGNVDEEVRPFKKYAEVTPLSQWFEEEWFKEKRLIYLPLC